jgi:regulator of RNase E activity RraA
VSAALLPTGATAAVVADALDAMGLRGQALDPAVRGLAPGTRVVGTARPVRIEATDVVAEQPYDLQIEALERGQRGDVLVLAGGESGTRAAMWGELFSCAAIGRGVAGVVTDGLVRDIRQVRDLGFPVFAAGATPLDTIGRADVTSLEGPARCAGVLVSQGDAVIGDDDGVVIVPAEAIAEVAARVAEKARLEGVSRTDLLAGIPLRTVWERHGVL